MNILFAVSEVEDLVKTGGLADVGKALPMALNGRGHNVRIVLPYYTQIAQQYPNAEVIANINLHTPSKDYSFSVRTIIFNDIHTLLIDFPEYFNREGLYADKHGAYGDNVERFAFFSMAMLHACEHINFQANIVHLNDWHTSITSYLMTYYPSSFYENSRSVLTVHNAAFQGIDDAYNVPCLSQYRDLPYKFEHNKINLLKTGLAFTSKICAVSPSYAKELGTYLGSHGVDDIVANRQHDVVGILNGCDYHQWDPETDPYISSNFSIDDMSGKTDCKASLQSLAKMPLNPDIPIIGMVCRTTQQKGFGYILPILEQLLNHNLQIIIVGTGETDITQALHNYSERYPTKMAFIEAFKPDYAHIIEAGSDFFLMPSQFEPCGLNQMYSLAYATIPIVRAVGGLADTVIDISHTEHSTGFMFQTPEPKELLDTIRLALLTWYEDKPAYLAMMKRAMQTKFTWERAAQEYEALYDKI